jgi:hypothetical protein
MFRTPKGCETIIGPSGRDDWHRVPSRRSAPMLRTPKGCATIKKFFKIFVLISYLILNILSEPVLKVHHQKLYKFLKHSEYFRKVSHFEILTFRNTDFYEEHNKTGVQK